MLSPPPDLKFESVAAILQTRTDNVLLLPSGSNRMYEFVLDSIASLPAAAASGGAPAARSLERKISGRVHTLPGDVCGAALLALGGREALAASFADSSVRLFRLDLQSGRPEPVAVVREAISLPQCSSCALGAIAWLRNLSSLVLLANMTSALTSSSSTSPASESASGERSSGDGSGEDNGSGDGEQSAPAPTSRLTCTTGALVCLRVRDEGAPGQGALGVSDEAKLVRLAAPVEAHSLAVIGRVGRSCIFALSADRSRVVEHVLNY